MQTICVVGTGYVGLTTAVCFADLGNRVTGVEIDLQKLDLLRSGKTPIYEPGLQELLERNMRAGRLSFTDDYAVALEGAELVFITVG
ncbi:MAG: UDP-glucose 6-dehydrogenase, partial [Chloroflexaceae bacterium]|nr:UDP-glucose 6-dehydrogenase [Chloroflexaceae bacterium]